MNLRSLRRRPARRRSSTSDASTSTPSTSTTSPASAVRRKSVSAAIAVTTACAIAVGLVAIPASASRSAGPPIQVGETLTASFTPSSLSSIPGRAGVDGALAAAAVCGIHKWYYRIYVVGSGQTLFKWNFEFLYCYEPNTIWQWADKDDTVELRDPSIQGSTVPARIYATALGIRGALQLRSLGATFQYCPNGTCVKTFHPDLIYGYQLDGSRTYLGNVPLEQG